VILFSIHSEEWKSSKGPHQTALRNIIYTVKRSSWNRRIRRRRYNLIPAESKFKNLVLDHQDKFMMKAQHRYPEACVRPSTGCQKLPEEAQPNEAKYNKDKKNRLMRIDELHKFSDGTLTDVRTTLDDRLKGIQMRYLPQIIRRKSDKDRAAAIIQAIDKRLKTRRIMRSLERFVGGRLYEGDFRMLQRTI
nr:hypothetical protein [Tanacetum cinerariifolium]